MDDSKIIDLYWRRDEQAIEETGSKYGAYCRAVSMNILGVHEDAFSASAIHTSAHGTPCRLSVRGGCARGLRASRETSP